MPFCPTCRTEYRDGFSRCADCDLELVAALPADETYSAPDWVPVHSGPDASVRVIEMRLRAFGIPTERVPARPDLGALSEFHTPHLAGYQVLVPVEHTEQSRELIDEAIRSSSWEGGPTEDAEAVAQAYEDYDVRACPECRLFFHEPFSVCPGCGTELVPAVEAFSQGQAEPDRVIVAVGLSDGIKALRDRLAEAGFGAEAFEVEGWPVAAVDLPWRELTDRTADAECLLGLRPQAG